MWDEAELRVLALRELEALGGKDFRVPDGEQAGDRTDTVRVTVGRGGTVKDVQIRGDWRREIGGHRFGPALLEAYENANLAMMNSAALASLAQQRSDRSPSAVEYLTYVPEADLPQIWQMLSDVEDLMYRIDKLERAAGDIRIIHGPLGFLTARCSGVAVTSITVDPARVEQAEADLLRREALELFGELLFLGLTEGRAEGPTELMPVEEGGHPLAGSPVSAVETAIDQIGRNVARINIESGKLIDRCNSQWSLLSPPVRYLIHLKIKEFRAAVDRILTFADEVLAHHSGFHVEFVTELSTVLAEIAGEVTGAALQAATVIDISWAVERLAAACSLIVEKHIYSLLSIARRTGGRRRRR